MRVAIQILVLLLMLAGRCRAGEPPRTGPPSAWTGKDVEKVVEYQFKGPDQEPLSLISGYKLDTKKLKKYTVKSAELSAGQKAALLDATFSKTHRVVNAACYDPHHIFVFYAKDGRPLRAIEVCFECTTVVTVPELGEKDETHHDFTALARLTAELDLWSGGMTVEDFATLMKDREPARE